MNPMRISAVVIVALALVACGSSGSSSSNPPPSIVSISTEDFFLTRAVSENFSVTDGTAPYTYSAEGRVPGLDLSNTGLLSGTPTQAGSFPITVTVTDSRNRNDSINLTIEVSAPPLAIARMTGTYIHDSASADPLESEPYEYQFIDNVFETATGVNTHAEQRYQAYNDDDELETYQHTRSDYLYDNNGFYAGYEVFELPDDIRTYARRFTNDEEGRRIIDSIDVGGDDIVDTVITSTRDLDGRVTRVATEHNGTLIRQENRTYTAEGRRLRREEDHQGDGIYDVITEHSYDNANPLRDTEVRFDYDADGLWDRIGTITWTDNTDGSITRVETYPDQVLTFHVPAQNVEDYAPAFINISCRFCSQAERLRIDSNQVATFDLAHTREWDEAGRLTRFEHNQIYNNYRSVRTIQYDEEGKPLEQRTVITNDSIQGEQINVNHVEYIDWTIGDVRSVQFNIGAS